MWRIAALLALTFAPVPSSAYCSEPQAPSCLQLGDVDSFCEMQVKEYIRALVEHTVCVSQEDAETQKKIIRKWNCRIEGHAYYTCF